MIRPLAAALVLLPALAACDNGKDGTTIAFNAVGSDGNTVAGIDGKTGQMSIKAPGFSGAITLPKMQFSSDNFDMNGVHLYPGSTISGMNIDAQSHEKDGEKTDDHGRVRVSFASPAAPATVRDWFRERLTKAGFTLTSTDQGLTGTTDEHQPFRLDLTPDGAGKAKGVIVIGT